VRIYLEFFEGILMKNLLLVLNILFLISHSNLECSLSEIRVDFHEAMKPNYRYKPAFTEQKKHWAIAKNLYDDHIYNGLHLSEELQIPLIIHHIWLGSNLPGYAKNFRSSWIKHHPNWTFIFWTDHPQEEYGQIVFNNFESLIGYLSEPDHEQFIIVNMNELSLQNKDAYEHIARNFGEKSDIIRYEALLKIGGLYVDTDFECFKPFDEIHHCCDFYTGIAYDRKFNLFNGLIGCRAGCSIMKRAVESISGKAHTGSSFSYSGPYFFTECFTDLVESYEGKAVAFPVTFLYPWPNSYRHQSPKKALKWLRPESFALHYWKYSWSK
jgi:mannosyltransferase OCH1-like enzyme